MIEASDYGALREYEQQAGWDTLENIGGADDPGQRARQEAEYAIFRAYTELDELVEEERDIPWASHDREEYPVTAEEADAIGYEAVDVALFLRKATEAVRDGPVQEYLMELTADEHQYEGDASRGRMLTHDEREDMTDATHDLCSVMEPSAASEDRGSSLLDLVVGDGTYEGVEDPALSDDLDEALTSVYRITEHLPKSFEQYAAEKIERNAERSGSFGTGDDGYLEIDRSVIPEVPDRDRDIVAEVMYPDIAGSTAGIRG